MLAELNIANVLVLDIETVPITSTFDELSDDFKALWEKKSSNIADGEDPRETFFDKAGIYAEFSKIVCISVGAFVTNNENGNTGLRIKSFAGGNEQKILSDFAELLNLKYSHASSSLCGHNIKEFDVPFVCRRMLVNGVRLPKILDIAGKKPWEVNYIDTMQLWKFGDYKSYTSLNLLAALFNIPTPKDDIDGSQVAGVYWRDNDLDRIVTYCQKDVITTAQILLKYKSIPIIKEQDIAFV